MTDQNGFIPSHGGYRNLLSYQKAQIATDATVCFCDRFLGSHNRTSARDQMIQAARSGKQNLEQVFIREGGLRERMTCARLMQRNKHP